MFTAYAIDLDSSSDPETRCKTLDEALAQLREMIVGEIKQAGPDGPRIERYGIAIDPYALRPKELGDDGPFDPWFTTQRLMKKHGLDADEVLGSLIHSLWNQHYAVHCEDRKPVPHARSVLEMMVTLIKQDHKAAHRRVVSAIDNETRSDVVSDKSTAKTKAMLSQLLQQTLEHASIEAGVPREMNDE